MGFKVSTTFLKCTWSLCTALASKTGRSGFDEELLVGSKIPHHFYFIFLSFLCLLQLSYKVDAKVCEITYNSSVPLFRDYYVAAKRID